MNMSHGGYSLEQLVDELKPVRRLSSRRGMVWPVIITAGLVLLNGVGMGWRADLMASDPSELFLLRAGILLLLGGAAAHAVVSMACPAVGRQNNGWQMALAGALIFPFAAIIIASTAGIGPTMDAASYGMECMSMGFIGAFSTALPMIFWLRRGAPTSPNRAGWLTGIAAGALGAFAYNFHCPFENIVYIGFWYGLTVGGCALLGRLIVPSLIRW